MGLSGFIGFQLVGLVLKRLLTGSFRSPNRLVTTTLLVTTLVLGTAAGAYFNRERPGPSEGSIDCANPELAAGHKECQASGKDDVQPPAISQADGATHPSDAPNSPCDYATVFLVDENDADVKVTDIRQCYKILGEGEFGDPNNHQCLTYRSANEMAKSKQSAKKKYIVSGSTVITISYKEKTYSIETSASLGPNEVSHSTYYSDMSGYVPVFDDVRLTDYKQVCNFDGEYDCSHAPFYFHLDDSSNPFGAKRQWKSLSSILHKRFRPKRCAGK
ncbi:hypothetical protein DSM21852_12770 [Methylocystis bryophila]|nr:hypothetical protein DSM21852_12770 [Methylocystis bryophila]